MLLTELGDALGQQGRYSDAREVYQKAILIDHKARDLRGVSVGLAQMGWLALLEGDLETAKKRYRAALDLFQDFQEPLAEAGMLHQLGLIHERELDWSEAERYYREAARIRQAQGHIGGRNGVVSTWNQLGKVMFFAGKLSAAQEWFERVILGCREAGDRLNQALGLYNLARVHLARGEYPEAQKLAEGALQIERALQFEDGPEQGIFQLGKIYDLLARVAACLGNQDRSREYRTLARQAKKRFAGYRHEMQGHLPLILAATAAIAGQAPSAELESRLQEHEELGWDNLVAAVRQALAGERDEEALVADLDLESSMVIETILCTVDDPSILDELKPELGSPLPRLPRTFKLPRGSQID